jgi:hypothetical protein
MYSGLLYFRVALDLRILQTDGRTLWAGDEPYLKAVTYKGQQTEETAIHLPASSGILTCDSRAHFTAWTALPVQ